MIACQPEAGNRRMDSDTNSKWAYAILAVGLLVICIVFGLQEASLLGWI